MFDYVIIQAGGLGSRLKHLTRNKPKGIVPVENLPIIFHLFRKYPNKKFIVIADYKADVLESYLESFADVEYFVVKAKEKGTCAGISDAVAYIPENESFLLVWSDLILGSHTLDDASENINYLGISKEFECRWSFINNEFFESPSKDHGVAGLFIFKDKSILRNVPSSGEFVRWLSLEKIDWTEVGLEGTREVGTLLAYDETKQTTVFQCRPFNSMQECGKRLIKKPVDSYGKSIAEWEQDWYKKVIGLGYKSIPEVFSYNPLCLEKISGKNIYDIGGSVKNKEIIVDNIVSALDSLHSLEKGTYNVFDLMETYYNKTFSRLARIRNMIPFADEKLINVNGKVCHNPYFMKHDIRKLIKDNLLDCHYCLIHGDCTFSNMMLRDSGEIVLIDPRGYFGKTQYYGDPAYDWAKVYYSISGNYDCFNRKKFILDIEEDEVKLSIESNGWECIGDYFLSKINVDEKKIKLLHVLIWLSLTTYAWEDYDSICGAFYNGCYLLEEVLEEEK